MLYQDKKEAPSEVILAHEQKELFDVSFVSVTIYFESSVSILTLKTCCSLKGHTYLNKPAALRLNVLNFLLMQIFADFYQYFFAGKLLGF